MASLNVANLQSAIQSGDFPAARSAFAQLQSAGADPNAGTATVRGSYDASGDNLNVVFIFEVTQSGLHIGSSLLTVETKNGDAAGLSLQVYLPNGNLSVMGGVSFVGLGRTLGGDTLDLVATAALQDSQGRDAGVLTAKASVTLS